MTIFARIATAAAIALAATPILAVGAAHAETQSRHIAVSNIDFSRADHVAKFEHQISRAAEDLCSAEARQNSAKMQACRTDLRSQAVAALGPNQRAQYMAAQGFALAAN